MYDKERDAALKQATKRGKENWIKKLWRQLFPIRVQYVPQLKNPDIIIQDTEKDLLPELVKSVELCPAVYAWYYLQLAKLEKEFHEGPKDNSSEAMQMYAVHQHALSQQIQIFKDLIKLPSYSASILAQRKQQKKDIKQAKHTNWGDD